MLDFERVLVPVDFSELSDTVLRLGTELTSAAGRTIVLHVLESLPLHVESAFGPFVNTEGLERIRENARGLLDGMPPRHPDRKISTELREGKPAAVILDAAKRHNVDLIVLGTHGRGGLEHFFLGSVAARVVRKAACPVLTVRNATHSRG